MHFDAWQRGQLVSTFLSPPSNEQAFGENLKIAADSPVSHRWFWLRRLALPRSEAHN